MSKDSARDLEQAVQKQVKQKLRQHTAKRQRDLDRLVITHKGKPLDAIERELRRLFTDVDPASVARMTNAIHDGERVVLKASVKAR